MKTWLSLMLCLKADVHRGAWNWQDVHEVSCLARLSPLKKSAEFGWRTKVLPVSIFLRSTLSLWDRSRKGTDHPRRRRETHAPLSSYQRRNSWIQRRIIWMWTHICSFDSVIWCLQGKAQRIFFVQELRDGLTSSKRIQCALPALSSWHSRKVEAGSKAHLCRSKRFPSALGEFQEGCPLHPLFLMGSAALYRVCSTGLR